MQRKVALYREGELGFSSIYDSYQCWQAYARWGDTYKLREDINQEITRILMEKV